MVDIFLRVRTAEARSVACSIGVAYLVGTRGICQILQSGAGSLQIGNGGSDWTREGLPGPSSACGISIWYSNDTTDVHTSSDAPTQNA